jgi:hypothetical protein
MKKHCLFISLIAFFLIDNSRCTALGLIPIENGSALDTNRHELIFGMRAREKPKELGKVKAPVIVGKSPTNEATLIRLSSGTIKMFYINRPGKADKMMSSG